MGFSGNIPLHIQFMPYMYTTSSEGLHFSAFSSAAPVVSTDNTHVVNYSYRCQQSPVVYVYVYIFIYIHRTFWPLGGPALHANVKLASLHMGTWRPSVQAAYAIAS